MINTAANRAVIGTGIGSMEFIGAGIHHGIVYGTSRPSLNNTEMQYEGLILPRMSLELYPGGTKNFPALWCS